MEPFIGQVIMFGGNFAPRSWAFCEGQLLAISSHSALFSILGTIYGGDGRTTFALPDLRGRIAIHQGTGPGLPTYRLGQRGGNATTTLNQTNMPANITASVPSSSSNGTSPEASGLAPATTSDDSLIYASPATGSMGIGGGIVGAQSRSFSNQPPFTTVNYIIALQGTYPSRN